MVVREEQGVEKQSNSTTLTAQRYHRSLVSPSPASQTPLTVWFVAQDDPPSHAHVRYSSLACRLLKSIIEVKVGSDKVTVIVDRRGILRNAITGLYHILL